MANLTKRLKRASSGSPVVILRSLCWGILAVAVAVAAVYAVKCATRPDPPAPKLPSRWAVRDTALADIRRNSSDSSAYHLLGTTLVGPNDTHKLPDGRRLNAAQLFGESLRYNPDRGPAYFSLAYVLSEARTDSVVLPDGRNMTQRGLLIEALRCDTDMARAYNNLASLLGELESITLHDGRIMTARALLLEAQRCWTAHDSFKK